SHKPDRVMLPDSEKRQRRSEVLRILELRYIAARVPHRCARINKKMNPSVGVALILLDVKPIGPRKQLPIEMAKIIARHVRTMLGEVGGEAEIRRTMKARDESFDDGSSDKLERAYARE